MTAPAVRREFCTNCDRTQEVRTRHNSFLDVTMMLCKVCGHWIKCPECMVIKTTEHHCKAGTDE